MIKGIKTIRNYNNSLIYFFLFLFWTTYAEGQSYSNGANYVRMGGPEATFLLDEYFRPMGKSIGALVCASSSQATARKLMAGSIRLGVSVAFTQVPETNINLLNAPNLSANGTQNLPTVLNSGSIPFNTVTRTTDGNQVLTANGGLVGSRIQAPMFWGAIGLGGGTELHGFYSPAVGWNHLNNTGQFTNWGLGLQHNLLQHLWRERSYPVFVSAYGRYFSFKNQQFLQIRPQTFLPGLAPNTFDDQFARINAGAVSWGVIATQQLGFITINLQGGFQHTFLNNRLTGNFPVELNTSQVYNYQVINNPYKSRMSTHLATWGVSGSFGTGILRYQAAYYHAGPFDVLQLGVSIRLGSHENEFNIFRPSRNSRGFSIY